MRHIDAIKRVDRSPNNSTNPNYSEFCDELGITSDYCSSWNSKFNKRVRGYYLIKWLCTDTYVGYIVYYLDDEPVAVSWQSARKSDREYEFISKESAEKVRDFILSIQELSVPTFSLLDPNEEIDDFYSVNYTSQLLTNEGFVDGKHCTILEQLEISHILQGAIVKFDDDTTQLILIRDFKIPLLIEKEVV